MIDFDIMLKALKLTWIPRLLRTSENSNWCIIPRHCFRRMGGLNFLLRCNYDTNYFNNLPLFYKKILEFNELKILYSYDQKQELILFNNKDILVDGKPIFLSEWFRKGILSINESGTVLTFHVFRDKYSCESNFYSIIKLLVLFRNTYGLYPNALTPSTDHPLPKMIISFLSTNRHKLICSRLSQRTFTTCSTSRFIPKIKRTLNVGAKNSL